MQVLTRGSYCNSVYVSQRDRPGESHALAFAYYGEFQRFDKEIA